MQSSHIEGESEWDRVAGPRDTRDSCDARDSCYPRVLSGHGESIERAPAQPHLRHLLHEEVRLGQLLDPHPVSIDPCHVNPHPGVEIRSQSLPFDQAGTRQGLAQASP